MAKNVTRKTVTKRNRKNIERGAAHIHSSFNNTIVSVTDVAGNVIAWGSAGGLGFKGSRILREFGGGDVAVTAAKTSKEISSIKDVTPIPHNGCRPPKRRRV